MGADFSGAAVDTIAGSGRCVSVAATTALMGVTGAPGSAVNAAALLFSSAWADGGGLLAGGASRAAGGVSGAGPDGFPKSPAVVPGASDALGASGASGVPGAVGPVSGSGKITVVPTTSPASCARVFVESASAQKGDLVGVPGVANASDSAGLATSPTVAAGTFATPSSALGVSGAGKDAGAASLAASPTASAGASSETATALGVSGAGADAASASFAASPMVSPGAFASALGESGAGIDVASAGVMVSPAAPA
mmetsp:Transcript_46421/g.129158  ORF Transcript_46421/g.129158 Transcript_46421/m.129158 type:complete len:254 (+) Transcript_46421:1267-2028(+)